MPTVDYCLLILRFRAWDLRFPILTSNHPPVVLGIAKRSPFGYLTLYLFLCYATTNMAKYILPVEIQHLEEGGYLARSPALPGFLVQADTIEEVVSLAPGVAQALIESMRENDVPLPQTLQAVEPPFHTDLLVRV
jgi:predicted RNase H-like HicB family nuclease